MWYPRYLAFMVQRIRKQCLIIFHMSNKPIYSTCSDLLQCSFHIVGQISDTSAVSGKTYRKMQIHVVLVCTLNMLPAGVFYLLLGRDKRESGSANIL
ncbi:hypothetical protein XELAEV_18034842mg [Xenopus laevis]|uniref:Uncharacterized protein n=1 Tax=Xenopus laevis TaxID=8355 RepID=A0A974CFV3_XENLA|nr:hypothetical protein XELAEV_18034842mg [Xenopus laevis]